MRNQARDPESLCFTPRKISSLALPITRPPRKVHREFRTPVSLTCLKKSIARLRIIIQKLGLMRTTSRMRRVKKNNYLTKITVRYSPF